MFMNSNAKLKEFWGESSHFADLFNTVFFGGRAVILPETLSETDTALTAAVKRKKRKGFSVEKFRDVFMTWRGHGLAVLGIENQTKADYVLPERLLLYDALGYEVQRRRIARKHRREKSLKASAEYLSGFKKSDKLLAQVTIVIYYGEKDWEGPRRLSDLMEIPEELEPYFNNYQIYIFSINTSDGSEFKDPEVRKILKAAYCLRRKRIEELEPMRAEEVSVLAAFVNSERLAELAESGEEEIKVCTALKEMIAEGEEQGMQRGIRETAAHMVRSMYKKGFGAEEIAGTLEWPLEKVKEYIK